MKFSNPEQKGLTVNEDKLVRRERIWWLISIEKNILDTEGDSIINWGDVAAGTTLIAGARQYKYIACEERREKTKLNSELVAFVPPTFRTSLTPLKSFDFDKIEAVAAKTAKIFADEFPGESLDPAKTDWDAVAWETDCKEFPESDQEEIWSLYQAALVRQVDILVE